MSGVSETLGSTGCYPVVLGSLPSTCAWRGISHVRRFDSAGSRRAAGKLSAADGLTARAPRRFV